MPAVSRREFIAKSATGVASAGFVFAAASELSANPLGLAHRQPDVSPPPENPRWRLCRTVQGSQSSRSGEHRAMLARIQRVLEPQRRQANPQDHRRPWPEVSQRSLRPERAAQQTAGDDRLGQRHRHDADGHGKPRRRGENGVTTMDAVKRAAEEYNKIAETAAKAGIQQFLHDEGFEVSHVDGRLTYEVLLELLDPKLVKMQFQMSAMPAVGDAVMYFNKYPGRFLSMHLQGVNLNPPAEAAPAPTAGQTAGGGQSRAPQASRSATGRGQRQRRLAQSLRRGQNRRAEELLRRAELGSDSAERGVFEDAEWLMLRKGAARRGHAVNCARKPQWPGSAPVA